jgi:hypothetical protein
MIFFGKKSFLRACVADRRPHIALRRRIHRNGATRAKNFWAAVFFAIVLAKGRARVAFYATQICTNCVGHAVRVYAAIRQYAFVKIFSGVPTICHAKRPWLSIAGINGAVWVNRHC